MRLPTQPIQSRQLGLERFDPFDSAVGPFSVDGPVGRVSYNEKNRFTHNFHAPMNSTERYIARDRIGGSVTAITLRLKSTVPFVQRS